MKTTRPAKPAKAGTKGTNLALKDTVQAQVLKRQRRRDEPITVRGLPPAQILARFTPNSRPKQIDEAFACRWVWWWRQLPAMVARYEACAKAGGGSFQSTNPEHSVAHFFRLFSKHVSFERFINHLFDAELEHRINGGIQWRYLPRRLVLPAPPPEYAEVKVELTLAANLSNREAAEAFLKEYRKVQDAAGIPRVKLNRSNAIRSLSTAKSGNGWARRFKVIELIDRATWGWDPTNDEMAEVRRLFRKRRLVRGW